MGELLILAASQFIFTFGILSKKKKIVVTNIKVLFSPVFTVSGVKVFVRWGGFCACSNICVFGGGACGYPGPSTIYGRDIPYFVLTVPLWKIN